MNGKRQVRTVEEIAASISCTVPEAKRLTQMSREKITKLCDDGKVAFLWDGNRRLVVVRSLNDYVESMASKNAGQMLSARGACPLRAEAEEPAKVPGLSLTERKQLATPYA